METFISIRKKWEKYFFKKLKVTGIKCHNKSKNKLARKDLVCGIIFWNS